MLVGRVLYHLRSKAFIHIFLWHHCYLGEVGIPMYFPSIAVLGVRKPRPTSLYHLLPPLPGPFALDAFEPRLWLRKTCGCFWKARSPWIVNSVAMIAVLVQSVGLARNSGGAWRRWLLLKFEARSEFRMPRLVVGGGTELQFIRCYP